MFSRCQFFYYWGGFAMQEKHDNRLGPDSENTVAASKLPNDLCDLASF